jgi:hypothetical protein
LRPNCATPTLVVGVAFLDAHLPPADPVSTMVNMNERNLHHTESAYTEPSAEVPFQYGIRDLLIAQAVCAFCLGLFAMIGIFALLIILAATLAGCFARVQPKRARLKRCIIDLMGGIALPLMCLLYDPFVFRESHGSRPIDFAFAAVVFQMLIFSGWLAVGWCAGRWNAVFSGMMSVGAAVAGTIGVCLAPFSLIGMAFMGLGFLGTTPFLTCAVFWRGALEAIRRARGAGGQRVRSLLFVIGGLLAVAIPLLAVLWLGPMIEWAMRSLPRPNGPVPWANWP